MITFKQYMNKSNKLVEIFHLNEMPQMVGDVTWSFLDDVAKNKQHLENILLHTHKTKTVEENNKIKIITFNSTSDNKIIGYDKANLQIIYYVSYGILGNRSGMVQTQLWRDKNNPLSKMMPINTIFNHIMKNYDMIVTDSEQSLDGKKFWINLLKIASNKGYDVGMLNVSAGNVELFNGRKQSIDKWIDKNQHTIWGSTNSYQNIKAFISTKGYIKQ